jgi:hypothetical protein
MPQVEESRDRLLENPILLQARGNRRLRLLGSEAFGKLLSHIAHTRDLNVQGVTTTSAVDGCRDLAQERYHVFPIAADSHNPAQFLQALAFPAERV